MLQGKMPFIGLKYLVLLPVLTLSMNSYSENESSASSAREIQETIAQAQQSLERARELGHGWLVTSQYIVSAETQLRTGQTDTARLWAQRALLTADMAVEQADTEALSWQARVPTIE